MPHGLLHDIVLSILAATVLAFVARAARQPLILAYLVAGILIGPPVLKWVKDETSIAQISELGLAFLLFIVGLEIDLRQLLRTGRVAAILGTVQVAACGFLGWAAALVLGFRGLPATYLGMAAAFSSTMLVVKLLSDRAQLDTVAGRLTLGVLLVQDVLAIVVLAVQPNLTDPALGSLAVSLLKGLALVAGTIFASRYVLPFLFRAVAKNPEVVLIASISWCFLVSFAAVEAGFSIAMGALLAGVGMSAFPYSLDVIAKIRSLRDFFVTLFFVSLGMQITVRTGVIVTAAAVLSAVVLLSRFVPVVPTSRALGYGYRIGIVVSLALGQVSEFSLVIVQLGLGLKHVDPDILSIVALSLVATSTVSTYLIQADQRIAGGIVRALGRRGIRDPQESETRALPRFHAPLVLLGCHRTASSLVPLLKQEDYSFLVVDFNPEVRDRLRAMGVPCQYGDISHPDTLEHAGVAEAKIVISSVADDYLRGTSNLKLLQQLRAMNPRGHLIVRAEKVEDAKKMYDAGADYVLLPRHLLAEALMRLLRTIDEGRLGEARLAEVDALQTRKEVVA